MLLFQQIRSSPHAFPPITCSQLRYEISLLTTQEAITSHKYFFLQNSCHSSRSGIFKLQHHTPIRKRYSYLKRKSSFFLSMTWWLFNALFWLLMVLCFDNLGVLPNALSRYQIMLQIILGTPLTKLTFVRVVWTNFFAG